MAWERKTWVFAPTFYFGVNLLVNRAEIENTVASIASAAAADNGLEFVHAEIAGAGRARAVRVFIDKPGGVTHEDCSAVSRRMESEIDSLDLIKGHYILEVSSPGIERGLFSIGDFARFKGSSARFKTFRPLDGQRNFSGKIIEVDGEEILFEDQAAGRVRVNWNDITKANLEFDLDEELKSAKSRGIQQKRGQ